MIPSMQEVDPIFTKWRDEEWIKIYHGRIHNVEDVAGDAFVGQQVANKRITGLRIKLERGLTRIFGNGVPGFVRDEANKVRVELTATINKVEADMSTKMKAAIHEVLNEREIKLSEKRETHGWDIVKMVVQFALSFLAGYLASKWF